MASSASFLDRGALRDRLLDESRLVVAVILTVLSFIVQYVRRRKLKLILYDKM
jgi:hypothetical protein